jgi:tRNA threonylcarbamoyladenosine biosynthesis protein TsaE
MRNKAPEWTCDTGSAEETLALARELGRNVRPGDWIALMGDLGSGKTVFARGLAEGAAPTPGRARGILRRNGFRATIPGIS